jgi:dTDP-4-amino-4,6-dideoxygalactose transaminase
MVSNLINSDVEDDLADLDVQQNAFVESSQPTRQRSDASLPIYLSPPHAAGDELRWIGDALSSNWIAPLGPMVDAFEKDFSEAVETPYALALSSGTAALHLGLHCLGVGAGDDVLAASLTFIASVAPAVYLGARPVFLDVDPATWTLNPELLEEALRSLQKQGRKVGAIVPTDLYGQSCDLDSIKAVAARFGVPVLCDCAEALGAQYKHRSVGFGADAAVFSFNGNKIITTSGGGMLVSANRSLIEHARYLSQQARDPAPHYQHSAIGYNYRLSNILAAIGRSQLRVLPARVKRKREIFQSYRRLLDGLPGITFMPEAGYGSCSRWLTVIQINDEEFGVDRDTVRQRLAERNIESRPVWKPMHLQPVFAGVPSFGGAVSEALFRDGLCLPSGTQLTDSQIELIANIIRDSASLR